MNPPPTLRALPPTRTLALWAAGAFGALCALTLLLEAAGVFAAFAAPAGPGLGAHAVIGAGAAATIWAIAWLVRVFLARREDHYVEDVEDDDLP